MRKICRPAILASAALAVALTVAAFPVAAASRHERHKIPPAPKGTKLPPEVLKTIEREFPKGKVTGIFLEEKGELEVMVTPVGSNPIEVVFLRKGTAPWRLAGYEYPVPGASLTPRAAAALKAKFPQGKITEVELVFSASWAFLGYQVQVQNGGTSSDVFLHANGTFGKDPL